MVGRTVTSRALRNKETTSAMNISQNALPFLGFVPVVIGADATVSGDDMHELENGRDFKLQVEEIKTQPTLSVFLTW